MASVQNSSEMIQSLPAKAAGNAAGNAAGVKARSVSRQDSLVNDAVLGKSSSLPEPTSSLLKDLSGKANMIFAALGKSLHYSVHDATKHIVVRVVDDSTGEVVREIPPTKFLDMVSKLEKLAGFVMDEKA
ncbi:MAG: flagellar protein FlaG [bacterium]